MPPRLNIPPVTRALLITLVIQSTLSAVVRYQQWTGNSDVIVVPYLTLVPSLSLIYPWVFLTTSLVDSNVFTLGISGVTIFYGGRYLERAWTSVEFVKFLALVTLIPNLLVFGTLVLLFALTGNEAWTLTTISGTTSIQIAFLVAFSQLLPAHTVTLFRGLLSLRVPRFPLIYIIITFLLSLTPLYSASHFLLSTTGFLVSWAYLRFYKLQFPDLDTTQTSSLRGDASETFAFAEFFPAVTRPAISGASNAIFDVLVSLKVCSPLNPDQGSAREAYIARTAPGSSRAETERRRALALKALDQRLHAATAAAAKQPSGSASADVTAQPKVAQAQMGGTAMLGETSYVPEGDKSGA